MMTTDLGEDEARFIMQKAFGINTAGVRRYATGYCHRVFEVRQRDGAVLVLRLTNPENAAYHNGCLYWLPRLRNAGLPVPEILGHGVEGVIRYALLSHIPGVDLGRTYADMAETEKRRLARKLAGIQAKIRALESPGGYGWTFVGESGKSDTWREHLVREVERTRSIVATNGVFDPGFGDRVLAAMQSIEPYLDAVSSKFFLDDITTKNVMIHNGCLSGIVDVDGLTLGDELHTLGLTKMALLNMNADTRYVDYWLEALSTDAEQRRSVGWYTLSFCFSFMGEVGTRYDNGTHIAVDDKAVERLNRLFSEIIELFALQ